MTKRKRISDRKIEQSPVIPLAFVEQLLTCTDGQVLVRKHLSINPSIIILAVITLFKGLESGEAMNCFDFVVPNEPTLNYLTEALKIVGLPDIADAVHTDIRDALQRFRSELPTLNLERMEKHAAAMQLLLAC